MKLPMTVLAGVIAVALFGSSIAAKSVRAEQSLRTPQSLRIEHDEAMQHLSWIAARHGRAATAASKVAALLGPHFEKEETFVFPPLSLLPAIAEGEVTTDMRPAIAMADQIRAQHDTLFEEHVQITDALNELVAAARHMHDRGLVTFARRLAAHALNEVEVLEPAALLVGDYVKAKLPPTD